MTVICDKCGKVLKHTTGKRGTNRDYYQTCSECLLQSANTGRAK